MIEVFQQTFFLIISHMIKIKKFLYEVGKISMSYLSCHIFKIMANIQNIILNFSFEIVANCKAYSIVFIKL